jgi:hypothetical protein
MDKSFKKMMSNKLFSGLSLETNLYDHIFDIMPSHPQHLIDDVFLESNRNPRQYINETFVEYSHHSIQLIAEYFSTHIQKINWLRLQITTILCIGCNEPKFILLLHSFLSIFLNDRITGFRIHILEKSSTEVDKLKAFFRETKISDDMISVEHINFVTWPNYKINEYDIVFTLISAPSFLLAFKFLQLTYQENRRHYFRESKLFVAPSGFISYCNERLNESDYIKKDAKEKMDCITAGNLIAESTYATNILNEKMKNLYVISRIQIQVIKATSSQSLFRYKQNFYFNEDETDYLFKEQCSLRWFIVEVIIQRTDKFVKTKFDSLFDIDHCNMFVRVDWINSSNTLVVNKNNMSNLCIMFCDECEFIFELNELQLSPIIQKDLDVTSRSNSILVYRNSNIPKQETNWIKDYLQVAVKNANACLNTLRSASISFVTCIVKAISPLNFKCDENKSVWNETTPKELLTAKFADFIKQDKQLNPYFNSLMKALDSNDQLQKSTQNWFWFKVNKDENNNESRILRFKKKSDPLEEDIFPRNKKKKVKEKGSRGYNMLFELKTDDETIEKTTEIEDLSQNIDLSQVFNKLFPTPDD